MMCREQSVHHVPSRQIESHQLAYGPTSKRLLSVMGIGNVGLQLYLYGLLCHWIDRPSSSDLELVENHVPEALVEDNAYIDVGSELLTSDARVHRLVAVIIVS